MQNEDNNEIRNTPLVIEARNKITDASQEIFLDMDEVYSSSEILDYPEYSKDYSNKKSKSKTIGTITGVGISSMGVLTFIVAVILSMMVNNPFSPSIKNVKTDIVDGNSISYSFNFTNPYGISMYCDLENIDKESIGKVLISGLGNFQGVFNDLDYESSYTFVVYSEQYNSKVYYYQSDILNTLRFTDYDFKVDLSKEIIEDKIYLNYELKYPRDLRENWINFELEIHSFESQDVVIKKITDMKSKVLLDNIYPGEYEIMVRCYDTNMNKIRILKSVYITI